MKYGKLNIIIGAAFILVAAFGGVALGGTFDQYSIQDGNHLLTEARFYLREGHSHGMPMGLLNLMVGIIIDRLGLSDKTKSFLSWAAVLTIFLPIGLFLKGAFGAPKDFPPIGLIGIIAFVAMAILLFIGGVKIKKEA